MKIGKSIVAIALIGLSVACTNDLREVAVKPADAQLVGRWKLVKITYGFSQLSTTPLEAGYSETLVFNTDGTYQRLVADKSGKQEEKGSFYLGDNPYTSPVDQNAVYYVNDKTLQPYSFQDGRLSMYQRGAQGALIADGSTYEYQRQ